LQSLSQQVSAKHPLQGLICAFFFSLLIHLFLALLLWKVTNDHIPVEPVFPLIDTPLIVSLTTLPSPSQEHSHGTERKPEAVNVVTLKEPGFRSSETHNGVSSLNNNAPSIDSEAIYRMKWNFGNISKLKAEAVDEIINQGVKDSDKPWGNNLFSYLTSSYGLEAGKRFEQVFREISEPELQRKKIEWRVNYIKKYEASLPPDCSTYYMKKSFNGLFAVPLIIKDAISDSDNACTW
jgi:hypothetical protein